MELLAAVKAWLVELRLHGCEDCLISVATHAQWMTAPERRRKLGDVAALDVALLAACLALERCWGRCGAGRMCIISGLFGISWRF